MLLDDNGDDATSDIPINSQKTGRARECSALLDGKVCAVTADVASLGYEGLAKRHRPKSLAIVL